MRRTAIPMWVAATFVASTAAAQAGPCTADIARLEQELLASRGTPDAGPSAPQSLAADQEHQPTPATVARAKMQAQAKFDAVIARAKKLDSQNDPACAGALTEARMIYFE
jgi:hypothetical protein